MLALAHQLLIALYLGLPPAAIAVDVIRARRRKIGSPSGSLVLSIFAAIPLGVTIPLLYAYAVGGKVRLTQLLCAVYFAAGLLLVLRAFDGLLRVPSLLLRRRPNDASAETDRRSSRIRGTFDVLSGVVRIALLLAIGLPYVIAAALTYRPKLTPGQDPARALNCSFDSVRFVTDDRYRIAGWWIPTIGRSGRAASSDRTVLICHGMIGDKSTQLVLAKPFIARGYNVLIFDFRAYGESDGQLTSFGDLERRDVLAAVRWMRDQHPRQSRHVFGVGVDTGAAALLAAAADPSPEGQEIEAVAVYGTFDSLDTQFHSIVRDRFAQPLRLLLTKLGLPIASLQVGADLTHFSPVSFAQQIWPRPIMVIHGVRDQFIDFDGGSRLYDQIGQPKRRLWVSDEGHEAVIKDRDVGRRVREFFDSAEPLPVI